MNSDERNKNLRKMLRSLPEKKAKSDFEARLFQRIRALEEPVHEKKTEAGFFSKFLKPYLAPALGVSFVIMLTMIVYLSYFVSNKGEVNQMSANEKSGQEFVIYRPKNSNETRFDLNKEIASLESTEKRNSNSPDMSPETKQPSDFFAPSKSIDDGIRNEVKEEIDLKDVRKKSETKEPSPSRDKDVYEREDEPLNIRTSDEKSKKDDEVKFFDKNLGKSVVSDSVKAKSKKDSTKKSDTIKIEKDDTLKK